MNRQQFIITTILLLLTRSSAFPIKWIERFTENDNFDRIENSVNKLDSPNVEHYRYSTIGSIAKDDVEFRSITEKNLARNLMEDAVEFMRDGASAGLDLFNEVKNLIMGRLRANMKHQETSATNLPAITSTKSPEKEDTDAEMIISTSANASSAEETTTEAELTTIITRTDPDKKYLDPIEDFELSNFTSANNRSARQEEFGNSGEDEDGSKDGATSTSERSPPETPQKESQESSEEEENPNMITGLISAFLGGLSRPDGSVDVEAITGLLGSLSSQNDDGTYDFGGLTDLLMSFFGGGEDGGGSDFGAFIGGLLGAFIKGVANPPGAKGGGVFIGNLLTNVLPGLSAPAPPKDGDKDQPPPKPLDSGGFLSGLLSTLLGSVGALSGGSAGSEGGGSKFSLFKAVFSAITSIFSSSSHSG